MKMFFIAGRLLLLVLCLSGCKPPVTGKGVGDAGSTAQLGIRAPADGTPVVRTGLVIGNSRYKQLPRLDACKQDAEMMAATFEQVGITVYGGKPLLDVTADQMDAAVSGFARSLQRGSEAFLYYSGHGTQIGGGNYLLPVNFDAQYEAQAKRQAISLDAILQALEKTDSRLRVVILDACRDPGNLLPGEPVAKSGALHAKGLDEQRVDAPETLVCFATKHGSVSLADDKSSFYSRVLAEEMVKPARIEDVLRIVARRVYTETDKRQLPFTYGSLLQDHYFVNPARLAPPRLQTQSATPGGIGELLKATPSIKVQNPNRDEILPPNRVESAKLTPLPQATPRLTPPAPAPSQAASTQANVFAPVKLLTIDTDPKIRESRFAPDGRVFSFSNTGVSIWDPITAQQVGGFSAKLYMLDIFTADISPNGKLVVVADNPENGRGRATVLDTTTGRVVSKFTSDRTANQQRFEFAANSRQILTIPIHVGPSPKSGDPVATVWDSTTGKETCVLRGHGKPPPTIYGGGIYEAHFSTDGRRVATCGWDGTARVWDATSGNQVCLFRGHDKESVDHASFSADGARVVSASSSTVKAWDASSGHEIFSCAGRDAQFSPDGRHIVVLVGDVAKVWQIEPAEERGVFHPPPHEGFPQTITLAKFLTTGTQVWSKTSEGDFDIWGAQTGTSVSRMNGYSNVRASFSRDYRRMIYPVVDWTISVWKTLPD